MKSVATFNIDEPITLERYAGPRERYRVTYGNQVFCQLNHQAAARTLGKVIMQSVRSVGTLEPFTCRGCGREESECSANPCAAVIADRGED